MNRDEFQTLDAQDKIAAERGDMGAQLRQQVVSPFIDIIKASTEKAKALFMAGNLEAAAKVISHCHHQCTATIASLIISTMKNGSVKEVLGTEIHNAMLEMFIEVIHSEVLIILKQIDEKKETH